MQKKWPKAAKKSNAAIENIHLKCGKIGNDQLKAGYCGLMLFSYDFTETKIIITILIALFLSKN